MVVITEATLLSATVLLFLPAYGYLMTIHSELSGIIQRVEGIDYRLRRIEGGEKHVYDD